jgi:hypothetical protein
MKKICLVLAVMALASIAASATNINFTFDGYCDAMELTLTGSPKVYLDGTHDYSECGIPSVLVGGFAHTIPTYGSWLDLMDPTYGYLYGLPYGLEYLSNSNTKKACEWAVYLDFSEGSDVLINSGTCTYFTALAKRQAGKGLPSTAKRSQN